MESSPVEQQSDASSSVQENYEMSENELAAQEALMAKDGALNMPALIVTMKRMNEAWPKEECLITDYSAILVQWTGVMAHLGSALVVAFKDAREKSVDFLANTDLFVNQLKVVDPSAPEARFVVAFTTVETKYNVQHLNRDANKKLIKKHFKKEQVQPWMKNYASSSRHLWRGQWLFEFLGEITKLIVTRRGDKLSKLAREAYKKCLECHHPYVLKKIASAAMIAVRNRDKFIASVVAQQSQVLGKQCSDDDAYAFLTELSQQSSQLAAAMLITCKKQGYDQLP